MPSGVFTLDFLSLQDCRTALHWACSAGHTNIVEFLLDLGVEVNLQDDVGPNGSFNRSSLWETKCGAVFFSSKVVEQ